MAWKSTDSCGAAAEADINLKNARNVRICPVMSTCMIWYSIISKSDEKSKALREEILSGLFLCSERGGEQRCQEDRRDPAVTPDVLN